MAADLGLYLRRAHRTLTDGLYTTLTRTTLLLGRSLPLRRSGKLSRAVLGRLQAADRWIAWVRERREGTLIWVHAASVGETLAAVPVVARMQAAEPELCFILSYSSPSAAEWVVPKLFEKADYLPPDDPKILNRIFSALRPAAILFSRGDLWPNLVKVSSLHEIPAIVVGGSVSPESLRLRQPAKSWLRRVYSRLDFVSAVSRPDASRFMELGVRPGRIAVTGDPRHDYTIERPVRLDQVRPFVQWAAGDPVIVAGSTDATDEQLVLKAFSLVSERRPGLKLVLVPHEPRRAREISPALSASALWTGEPAIPAGARIVVVGKLGLLADLYLIAAVAHVGGGFKRSGVHSVVEPAAFGIPVTFGPNYGNSPDAEAMLQAGGAVSVPRPGSAAELATRWLAWLEQPAAAVDAGRRNRKVLKQGSADISARAVLEIIRSRALHTLQR
ncbi:3-deoxy-D-manno-octulosonic acid transferase [bacterium HR33]|nr:3-deoxy-D-manno-octulosonic acid transferase [bacterium HR33]